jgi:hypothetical protein
VPYANIFTENFNSMAAWTQSTAGYFASTAPGLNGTGFSAQAAAINANRYLHRSLGARARVRATFRVKTPAMTNVRALRMGIWGNGQTVGTGTPPVLFNIENDGTFRIYTNGTGIAVTTWAADTEYEITLEADCVTDKTLSITITNITAGGSPVTYNNSGAGYNFFNSVGFSTLDNLEFNANAGGAVTTPYTINVDEVTADHLIVEAATTYTVTPPVSIQGTIGVASSPYSVEMDGSLAGSVTVTITSSVPGDTITPSTLTFNASGGNVPAAQTFTINPSTEGARTLTFTNSGGLANAASRTYTGVAIITIASPVTRRGYQRNLTTDLAAVTVTGTYAGAPTSLQYRYIYTDTANLPQSTGWQTLVASPAGNAFTATINLPTGYGRLEVRFSNSTSVTAAVALLAIGDVWVGGPQQSNGSGRRTTTTDTAGHPGCVMFTNAYGWAMLADPTDSATGQVDSVSNDATNIPGGSPWPRLFGRLARATGVPQIFIPCAKGGSSVSGVSDGSAPTPSWAVPTNHQDRTTLYGSMIYRVLNSTGAARAAIDRLHESDMRFGTSVAAFIAAKRAIIQAIYADLGIPTVVPTCHKAAATWGTLQRQTDYRQAELDIVAAEQYAIAGPDLYPILDSSNAEQNPPGDDIHIVGDAAATIEENAWFDMMMAEFYPDVSTGGGGGGGSRMVSRSR